MVTGWQRFVRGRGWAPGLGWVYAEVSGRAAEVAVRAAQSSAIRPWYTMPIVYPVRLTDDPNRSWVPRIPAMSLPTGLSRLILGCGLILASVGLTSQADEAQAPRSSEDPIPDLLTQTITPFLARYCQDCHGLEVQEAKLDLTPYSTPESLESFHQTWEEVVHRVEAGEMPPADAEQPPDPERMRVTQAIREARRELAFRKAGDPGPVLTRRLSHSEYNYTIRDLIGVDLRPTSDFPIDPANEAGFDNTGESLAMSPSLMQKYLAAARSVAEHLVLKPDGFDFAAHPVVTDTDRDKYAVRRIIEFYQSQPTDLADYLFAAWLHRVGGETGEAGPGAGRGVEGSPPESLVRLAADRGLSTRYVGLVWAMLCAPEPVGGGPLATIQRAWWALPEDAAEAALARERCEAIRDQVQRLRRRLEPTFENLQLEGGHLGSQQFVLWKNDQYAAHRRRFVPQTIASLVPESEEAAEYPELVVPVAPELRADFERELERFCELFPDAFYVSERGRDYVGKRRDQQEKGRLLSAGFHSMMGYYRDDLPLYELILNDADRAEIDRLWQELDYITAAPLRQYTGFVWFERTDSRYLRDEVFDFARAEDKSVTDEPMIQRLAEAYRAKAVRNGGSDEVLQAIDLFFERINDQIRWVERARQASEPHHLQKLVDFAARAYRRPVTADERQELLAFYRSLREDDGLSHEEAMQDSVVSILMSPWFWYRADLVPTDDDRRLLSDFELANRLSYFLWSSMPDQELVDLAAAGRLSDPEVLVAQAMRMLKAEASEALAIEFAGNWLDFRHFAQHNSVDRERYPQFTDSLRQAMFEEPIRFFSDLVRRDGSVLEFLESTHTFVNAELAAHYHIAFPNSSPVASSSDAWRRVEVPASERGGLLAMAVFQTANSPGLRTSPVKRGYWVARRLLGERIPAPPPDVPDLPADEQDLGPVTLAAALAKHREHSACAGCHERFDSFGLALENFDPIGQWRTTDLAGHPVEAAAEFPGGAVGVGVDGLRAYLLEHRRQDFVDHLCRQLLSYGLGRNLILSDEPLLNELREALRRDEFRFSSLVTSIITSPQFLQKRGRLSP